MQALFRLLILVSIGLSSPSVTAAEPSPLSSPPLRTAFGSRCAKSPIPCNRIDYLTAHFHLADLILLPSTDSRGFGATVGYDESLTEGKKVHYKFDPDGKYQGKW